MIKPGILVGGLLFWICLMVIGYALLAGYEQKPGATALVPETLDPEELGVSANQPLLVMALHPRCACSRASVGELAKILSHAQKSFEVLVFFYKPTSEPDEWTKTELYRQVAKLGGTIRPDEDGVLAESLGLRTSGHVLLYDAQGQLRFSGGITASRGHEGSNRGGSAVLQVLGGDVRGGFSQPVFGCSLKELETTSTSTTDSP